MDQIKNIFAHELDRKLDKGFAGLDQIFSDFNKHLDKGFTALDKGLTASDHDPSVKSYVVVKFFLLTQKSISV